VNTQQAHFQIWRKTGSDFFDHRDTLKRVNDVLTVSRNSTFHFIVPALTLLMYFSLPGVEWNFESQVVLKLTFAPQVIELPYSLSFSNCSHSNCHTNLKSVIWISTYSTAPLCFRSIFKEKGSFLNSTLYFPSEAFDVAFGMGTGTSYLWVLES